MLLKIYRHYCIDDYTWSSFNNVNIIINSKEKTLRDKIQLLNKVFFYLIPMDMSSMNIQTYD